MTTKTRVLLVEDEVAVSKMLSAYLGSEGFEVTVAGTVAAMQSQVQDEGIGAILLDVGLPDQDGWTALRWLRARSNVPVIMLTGKAETIDKIVGLEMGADDYLVKPFDLRELLARIRTVLRRTEQARAGAPTGDGLRTDTAATVEQVHFGNWVLDTAAQQLKTMAGELVKLTLAEYRILSRLAANPHTVVTREQLLETIARRDWNPLDRSVDVHVSNLRRKLDAGDGEPLIRSVRGVGYMFVPPASN